MTNKESNSRLRDKVNSLAAPVEKRGTRTITISVPRIPKVQVKNLLTRTQWILLALVLVVGILGGLLGGWIESSGLTGSVFTSTTDGSVKLTNTSSANELVSTIAKQLSPSVVSIVADTTSSSSNLFGFSQPIAQQSEGTGIIISSNGLVLTNRHVVPAGTSSVSITLSNGTQLNDVSVVGRTSQSDSLDIAILKINNTEGQTLTPALLGDSSTVQVGDGVVAIGNALGQFQNTVTSGIISGYGRDITAGSDNGSGGVFGTTSPGSTENLTDMFQTDAAINEGNSGGPLVNLNGQVIGVNTAIASDSQNIGFAIPINEVKGLIEEVVNSGKFERPFLGVRFELLTPQLAKQNHLSVTSGAYIPKGSSSSPSIISGSAAAKAGLKQGDVITAVNNIKVDQNNDLTTIIDQFEPGTRVSLSVERGSKSLDIKVTLGSMSS